MKNISHKDIEDILALTPLQEGMLFHYLREPGSEHYFEQFFLEISGKIDSAVFERAWNVVIEINEALRTVFRWEKLEKPTQIILKKHKCKTIYYDLSNKEDSQKIAILDEIKSKDRRETFDLRQVPFRVILFKKDEFKYEVVISNHHIIYDGWSNGIILKEFFKAYNDLCGGAVTIKPVKTKFKEFIKWIQSRDKKKQERYWREYLERFETSSEFPIKRIRKMNEKCEAENYSIQIEEETQGKLELFVNRNQITLASVFYSAWGILLQHYCNNEDSLFGVTVSGRNAGIKGIDEMVGLFINTIPFRVNVSGEEKLIDVVLGIENESHAREEYDHTPLTEIKTYSGSPGAESLFDTIVVIENYPIDNRLNPPNSPLRIESYTIVEKTHYDLAVGVMLAKEITITFYYNRGLFDIETVENLAGHFKRIMRHILDDPERKLCRLEIISEGEKGRILYDFNNTHEDYPKDKTIHELFRGQAEKTPDRIALIGISIRAIHESPLHITYDELNEKSNRLAHMLRENGARPNTIVGIMIDRSIEMMIGILGILKSGAAYLPIDPSYPPERVQYMLEDSESPLVLTGANLAGSFKYNGEIIDVEIGCRDGDGRNIEIKNSLQDMVYMIYTSGSTGKPKGVMVKIEGFLNLLHWYVEEFEIGEKENILLIAPISFDLAQKNLFSAYMMGGRLTLASPGIPDYCELSELIHNEQVTLINCAPSVFYPLIELNSDSDYINLKSLRRIILGGEPIQVEKILGWVNSGFYGSEIVNTYGPTECTDIASCYRIPSETLKRKEIIPIGKPISNVKVYILDKRLGLLPEKIAGELCIGGVGLSKGYYNNKQLTKEKFVETPHLPEKKVYRTGDLTRWLSDGNIEFLGRIDHQVKIRGFRIELGEIENELSKHGEIKDVVVVSRASEKGSNYLCAYIVSRGESRVTALREYLRKSLPEYMIPAYFTFIDKIPLTPSGKVDRKALPDPEIKEMGGYVAPRDMTEEKLVEIWSGILVKDGKIGIDDNFFHIGGHSLKATVLVSKIHKNFNVNLPLEEIFKRPTIRGISEKLREAFKVNYTGIETVEEKEYYALSSAQKRLCFLIQMDKEGTTYNMPAAWILEGKLDRNKLEDTFVGLIKRHESLRTFFEIIEEEPVQRILQHVKFAIECFDSDTESVRRPFDLSKAPLFRVGLIRIDEEKHILTVDMSHIISDGVSIGVLIRDFTSIYAGKESSEIKFRYIDYVDWENRRKGRGYYLKQVDYWRKEFEEEIPKLDLPIDYTRPTLQEFEGKSIDFEINKETTVSLRALAYETGATLYMTLLALYNILLSKICSSEDIIIGAPVAGRRHADLESIIGMFVNTLAVRNYPKGEKKFIDFLFEVKEKALNALENQDCQYEELVEQLALSRDIGRNPLFDTMFALQNFDTPGLQIPGLSVTPYPNPNDTSKFDLSLNGTESDERIHFTFEYSVKLFKQETIERFIDYFKKIVKDVIENKDWKILDIEIITEDEKNRILYDFNDTQAEYPYDKTIHEIFRGQAEKTPDHIALVFDDMMLTYRELDKQSNSLAHELHEQGILSGDIVGIKVERSIEMVIGILGILKSGAAYLPIDPDYPRDRIDFMIKDSGAKWLVTNNDLEELPNFRLLPATGNRQLATSLAYVIYTSGSTGKPKGVIVEHRSVVNLLYALQKEYPFTESDVYLLKTSYIFDVSVAELFGWYIGGGRLAVLEKGGHKDPRVILDWIEKYTVTHLNFVSSMFNVLIEHVTEENKNRLSRLKYIFLAGEALLPELVRKFRELKTAIKLENIYGPTESTVYASKYSLTGWDGKGSIPIGKPLPNIELYIYDKNSNLQPIGIPGELCISGIGLAKGYLNRPDLTSERFTLNTNTLYKTGDLSRWLSDGNLEYLGRIDQQVKVRGFRIELGEIENRLLKYERIKESVVICKNDGNGDNYLCAYICSDNDVPESELREYIGKSLPDYMIPAYFMRIDKIPLTPGGKVDRKALPETEIKEISRYVAPRDEIEEKLVEIWSEILGTQSSIGIDDNFFHLGGHSLKATVLVSKIHKNLNVNLPLGDVFKTPTIRGISEKLKEGVKASYTEIDAVEQKEYYILSSAQKRLHFLSRMDKNGTSYNIPASWILEGALDRNKIENTFAQLIKRHESLRTAFEIIDEEPVQRIHENVDFKIKFLATEGTEDTEEKVNQFIRPFDLTKAPLMRVGLIRIEEEKHIMIVDIHHIVSDGMSAQVLIRDFIPLYTWKELKEIKFQYKDYSEWRSKEKENLQEQEEYWKKEFEGLIPTLELPTDYSRPAVQSFEGDSINFEISKETIDALKALMLETGTTLFMALLAIYNVYLSKISGQEEIVIGSPVSGRRHADLEEIIGMFVNTLALRNYPSGEKTFTGFLHEVKERTLKAIENQDYQYDELVEQVAIDRDISRNPLFDTMFTFQNFSEKEVEIPGLKLVPYAHENKTSKFDLTLIGLEREEKLFLTFEYSTKLFKHETIERFIDYFKKIVKEVTENKNRRISEIEIITEEEKKRIVFDFNDTQADYPKDKTIHSLFEDQVDKIPDHIALVFDDKMVTYCEFDKRANSLAHYLIEEKGICVGDRVAVLMDRSIELIVTLMGILKSGGAYLPINPKNPQERIDFMLKDSGARITVGDRHACPFQPLNFSTSQLLIPVSGGINACYVMYTSGSSGTPKGVLVEHRTIVNTLEWRKRNYEYGPDNASLQIPPYYFDSSVTDIFTPLLGGARLVLIKEEERVDLEALKRIIPKNRVSHFIVVPVFYNVLLEEIPGYLKGVKMITCAGDNFPDELIRKHFERLPNVRVFNEYGPTENSVNTSAYELKPDSLKALIGKPIGNVQIYILDRYLKITPIGVMGEICLAGSSLAVGYLNRPELTNEKFIMPSATRNPFEKGFLDLPKLLLNRFSLLTLNTNTLYKTGDLARFLSDGNIEFLGREDAQVKIRGIRIETGEIENQLMKREGVKEAIVLAREGIGEEKQLCAYVVLNSGKPLIDMDLRAYLSERLPEYMVPSYFIEIESIPTQSNGKINKELLPAPEISEEAHTAPRNRIEEKLAEIWSEILSAPKEKISIDSDFFKLGGHSLKATTLASRVHKAFNVKLPLTEIFKTSTIRGISKYINEANEERYASIEPVEEREYYPLSSAQKRLFILDRMTLDSTAYNMPQVMPFSMEIDIEKLEAAFKELIKRHESLRTSFEMIEDEPVQRIHDNVDFKIKFLAPGDCIPGKDTEDTEEKIHRFIHPFNLTKVPLMRVGLIRIEEKKYIMIVDMNHIITDGYSQSILAKEFNLIYGGRGEELAPLRLQYKDYSQWQKNEVSRGLVKEQEVFWLKLFSGEIPVLNLPTDYPRPIVQSFEGETEYLILDERITRSLKEYALAEGVTLYIVLLGTVNIFLSRMSGQEDIIVGTPTAGRRHADLEKIIGMFVNTMALRNRLAGKQTITEFINAVKERTLESFENQEYQFEDLVEKLDIKRDLGRNPLFDVMVVLQNIDGPAAENTGEGYKIETSKFDLSITADETARGLRISFQYSTKLFKKETIRRYMGYFREIIAGIVNSPGMKLSQIDIIPQEEKNRILYDFNDTETEYPKDKTIHELFRGQAEKTPDRISIVGPSIQITYHELNEQSNNLAFELQKKGVCPDTIVGIKMERSIEMIIGIYGILKAGGAYLPIDPDYPQDRIDYMLKDSGARILLNNELSIVNCELIINNVGDRHACPSQPLNFSTSQLLISAAGGIPLTQTLNTNTCYVIYTSGTTGKPKGAAIEHRSLVNRINWTQKKYPLDLNDTILQKTTYTFDVSVWEIFWWSIVGAKVCLLLPGGEKDPKIIAQAIDRNNVTTMHFVPSMLSVFLDYLESRGNKKILSTLKQVIASGEALLSVHVKRFNELLKREIGVKLANLYGPTEATIDVSYFDCMEGKDREIIPIGKPIDNISLYILDKNFHIQPVGVSGELCISGIGLARGYLNRPELTAEKFITLTLNTITITFYKTGDLARWIDDGNIEYLGRIDHQVKIRGFRIELGEIEKQLNAYPGIKEAVVIDRNDRGRQYLCAYYAVREPLRKGKHPISGLKENLEGKLPGYMIPACFVEIEKIPLNANGKLDRKALPQPLDSDFHTGGEYEAPVNDMQRILVEIWQDVLGREKVGIQDNFFDIGGNSLDFVKVGNKLKEKLNEEIAVVTLFTYPTISSLAHYLSRDRENESITENPPDRAELIDEGKGLIFQTLRKLDEGIASLGAEVF